MVYGLRKRTKPPSFYNEDAAFEALKTRSSPRRKRSTRKLGTYTATASGISKRSATSKGRRKKAAPPVKKAPPLPLDESYVGKISLPKPPVRPKRKTWGYHRKIPILDINNVPRGWNDREPDLDPDDLDAQIERCHDRIKENIMPWIFKGHLKNFIAEKEKRDAIMAKEPGLSWKAVQRVQDLEGTLEFLEEEGDDDKQISNVRSLLDAYRSRKLEWNVGLVTYWSYGEQLCQPRPFDWEEFREINRQHEGHQGFWVEGMDDPDAGDMMYAKTCVIDPPKWDESLFTGIVPDPKHMITVQLRLFEGSREWPLEFRDDTGASLMTVYEEDIKFMQALGGESQLPPTLGIRALRVADGRWVRWPVKCLFINLFSSEGEEMSQWASVQTVVFKGAKASNSTPRLLGPWLRSKLYTATAPDGSSRLWICDKKEGLDQLPELDLEAYPASMPIERPLQAVEPGDKDSDSE